MFFNVKVLVLFIVRCDVTLLNYGEIYFWIRTDQQQPDIIFGIKMATELEEVSNSNMLESDTWILTIYI